MFGVTLPQPVLMEMEMTEQEVLIRCSSCKAEHEETDLNGPMLCGRYLCDACLQHATLDCESCEGVCIFVE